MPEPNHVAQAHVGRDGITVTLIDDTTEQFVAQKVIAWADIIDGGPTEDEEDSQTYAWRMFTDAVRPALSQSVITASPADHPADAIDTDEYHTLDEHDQNG
jgi:hypothetical protein